MIWGDEARDAGFANLPSAETYRVPQVPVGGARSCSCLTQFGTGPQRIPALPATPIWHVEQSFRMSKTDLAARPIFHHTRDAIEAHLTIVFTALAVSREIQRRTGLSIRNVCRQLRPLRSATIAINGATQTFPPEIPADRQPVLDAIRDCHRFAH